MSKEEVILLVKDFKKKLEEIKCHYSVSIVITSDNPNENEIITFSNDPKEVILPKIHI